MNKYRKFMPRRPLFLICLITVISSALYVFFVKEVSIPPGIENTTDLIITGEVIKIEIKNQKNVLYLKNISFNYGMKFNNNYSDSNYSKKYSDKYYSNRKYGVICYLNETDKLPEYGSIIKVKGKISCFSKATNPGQFDFKKYYLSLGYILSIRDAKIVEKSKKYSLIRERIFQFKCRQEKLLDKIMTPEDAGIIKAMILGDKTDMDKDIKQLYQENGIAHILAISGLHVSIIGMFVYFLLDKIGINQYLKVIISCAVLFIYAALTGSSIGLIRASVMYIVRLIAVITKRTYDSLTALLLAAAILCINNPYVLYNGGFYLSFLAVLGATTFSKYFINIKKEMINKGIFCKFKKYIINSVSLGMAVNVMTLPVISFLYYEIPLYSGVLNLIVIPFMTILLCAGIISLIAANFSLTLGRLVAFLCHLILNMYKKLCIFVSGLPYSDVITGKMAVICLICFYLIILLISYGEYLIIYREDIIKLIKSAKLKWIIENKKIVKSIIYVTLILLILIRIPGTYVIMLDVGQGDCFCLRSENKTVMIDGGSTTDKKAAENIIEPYLKSAGIRNIDCWLISHPDEDHVNGLVSFLENDNRNIKISSIALPDSYFIQSDAANIIEIATENDIPIVYLSQGDNIKLGALSMKCINPTEKYKCEDANDYSMVMLAEIYNTYILFTGDALTESEERYIKYLPEKVNILKVAHHGSSSSTGEKLLEKINPDIALISAGENNRYGHPHKETLDKLRQYNSVILRTDLHGAFIIKISRSGKISIL